MSSCEAVYCYDLFDGITTGWSVLQTSIELSYISQSHYVVHVAQLKCWVGTAGGSLGVFTVTRRSVGEPLQLEKTGNFVWVCIGIWNNFSFQSIFNQEKASRSIQVLQAFSYLCNPLQHMGLTPQ